MILKSIRHCVLLNSVQNFHASICNKNNLLNTDSQLPSTSSSATDEQHIHVHNRAHWPPEMLAKLMADCRVLPDFVNEAEEQQLLSELYPHLKRMRWEEEHWDDQIRNYREREQPMERFSAANQSILRRILSESFPPPLKPSPFIHILDLHEDGFIRPHLDKDRYCGRMISGLSLLSDSVMRLQHKSEELANTLVADLLLTRRSLYQLGGVARYEFTHALLAKEESRFGDHPVPRGRRIALICREVPIGENKK